MPSIRHICNHRDDLSCSNGKFGFEVTLISSDLNTFIKAGIKLPYGLEFNLSENGTILFQEDIGDPEEFYLYISRIEDKQLYHAVRITKYQTPEQIISNVNEGIREFVRNLNGMA